LNFATGIQQGDLLGPAIVTPAIHHLKHHSNL